MAEVSANIKLRNRLIRIHEGRRLRAAPIYLKERVAKLSGVNPEEVRISKELNGIILKKAVKMYPIKVSIEKSGGIVNVKPDKSEAMPKKDSKVQSSETPQQNPKSADKNAKAVKKEEKKAHAKEDDSAKK